MFDPIVVSSVVTAVATVALAIFGAGTWRLYRLERTKLETLTTHVWFTLANEIRPLMQAARTLDFLLERTDRHRFAELYAQGLKQAGTRLEAIQQRLPLLLSSATLSSARLVHALSNIDHALDRLMTVLPDIDEEFHPEDEPIIRQLIETIVWINGELDREIELWPSGPPWLSLASERLERDLFPDEQSRQEWALGGDRGRRRPRRS